MTKKKSVYTAVTKLWKVVGISAQTTDYEYLINEGRDK